MGGGGETLDLRFVPKYCGCRRKAALKVVGFERPSKGLLYYVCEQKPNCDFWEWCHPISVTWQPSGAPICAGRGGGHVNQPSYEEIDDNDSDMPRSRVVMAGAYEDQKWMKKVVCAPLGVSILCLLVILLALAGE